MKWDWNDFPARNSLINFDELAYSAISEQSRETLQKETQLRYSNTQMKGIEKFEFGGGGGGGEEEESKSKGHWKEDSFKVG